MRAGTKTDTANAGVPGNLNKILAILTQMKYVCTVCTNVALFHLFHRFIDIPRILSQTVCA